MLENTWMLTSGLLVITVGLLCWSQSRLERAKRDLKKALEMAEEWRIEMVKAQNATKHLGLVYKHDLEMRRRLGLAPAVPPPPSRRFVPGDVLTAKHLNDLTERLEYFGDLVARTVKLPPSDDTWLKMEPVSRRHGPHCECDGCVPWEVLQARVRKRAQAREAAEGTRPVRFHPDVEAETRALIAGERPQVLPYANGAPGAVGEDTTGAAEPPEEPGEVWVELPPRLS